MSPRTPRKKRTHRRSSRSFWRRLPIWGNAYARWIGGLLLGGIYIYFFYTFVVHPFTLRWKGIYGEARYPAGYSIRGIDVSHHQGRIDWEKLRHAQMGSEPVSFVFIKATEGKTLKDRNFQDNFYQARENGLIRGAYHYYVPSVPAREQAKHFISTVRLEEGDLPPVLDIEEVGDMSPEEIRREALIWLRTVRKHYGVKPLLYTYRKFKSDYLATSEFDEYPYWIAHYYVDSLQYEGPWKFWQHTDRGRLEGIKGYVDLNIYNGSMYDLRRLTIGAGK